MLKTIERPLFAIPLLLVLAGYFFFSQLGSLALTDPDETFYAQTAKEMLARDEWTTPYLYGKPQFEKPILFYWLIQASYRVFGVNEFAARFPSACMGAAGLILIYFFGSILFSRRTGLLAAIILASSIEYIVLARACVTDMTLTVFMLAGVAFFYYGYIEKKPSGYIIAAAAFALATLTKGPVFIVIPLAILFAHLLIARDLGLVKRMPIIPSVLVFLAIAVPWYIIAYKLHGKAFIDEFFGFHNMTRFTQSEHKIGSQVYYNLPILMGGLFPWSVFLPLGIWRTWKAARSADDRLRHAGIFLLLWLAVIFLFFTASSTKLPTYIFPAFISPALMIALLWDEFFDEKSRPAVLKGVRISFWVLVTIVIAGFVGGPLYAYIDYRPIVVGVTAAAFFLLYGVGLAAFAFTRGRYGWAFASVVLGVALFLYPFGRLVIPVLEHYETSKPIAMKLNSSYLREGDLLGCESNYLGGLAFYTGRFPVNVDKHHDLVTFLGSPERVWCVMKEKNHRELYELDTKPYYTKPSYLLYKIGKRSIVTNREPADGEYIIRRERTK